MTRRRKCPKHGVALVPVVNDFAAAHGEGDESMASLRAREARGEIVLWGDLDTPEWACPRPRCTYFEPVPVPSRECPTCGTPLVPVVFGFPNEVITAEDRAGRIVHVGCCPVDAEWACPKCRTLESGAEPGDAMSPRNLDSITVPTPFGPVTLVTDEKTGRARGATPLDAERWARVGDRIAGTATLALVPKARRKMTVKEVRRLPAKRKRQTADATAKAAVSPKRGGRERTDDRLLRDEVRRRDARGEGVARIMREMHMGKPRVLGYLSK